MSKTKQALPFKRGNTFYANPEDIFIPGVDDGEEHFLTDEDRRKRRPNPRMVKNMMIFGNIQPVIVAKEGDRVICVAGQRRLLAAREANVQLQAEGKEPISVEVKVKRGTPADLYGVYLSENEHRQGESVLSKARKAEKLREMGRVDEEIEVVFDVTSQTLRNWNVLLELDHRVQQMVDDGLLSADAAVGLRKLSHNDQYAKAQELLKESGGKKPSRRDVDTKVDPDAIRPPSKKLVLKLIDAYEDHDEAGDHFTKDFVRGMKYARGLISAADAGVEASIGMLSVKKQPTSEKDARIVKKRTAQ